MKAGGGATASKPQPARPDTASSKRPPDGSVPASSPPPIPPTIRPRRSCTASFAARAFAASRAWRGTAAGSCRAHPAALGDPPRRADRLPRRAPSALSPRSEQRRSAFYAESNPPPVVAAIAAAFQCRSGAVAAAPRRPGRRGSGRDRPVGRPVVRPLRGDGGAKRGLYQPRWLRWGRHSGFPGEGGKRGRQECLPHREQKCLRMARVI